jgi:hypothetical protein
MTHSNKYSDFLVFVDESGDHNLARIDPQFPVFVLLFAIFRKDDYVEKVCPELQRFKLEHSAFRLSYIERDVGGLCRWLQ